MADPLRPLRINAVELLRQPGTIRTVEAIVPADPLDAAHERLAGEIAVDLRLEALNDGIAVTGTVSAPWRTVCRFCLAEISGTAVGEVDELFQTVLLDPDAFLIEDGQLDLTSVVRETVLLELDRERQCRPDCAGLCPICGVDRNTTTCSCDTTVRDERWAALDELVLDDDPDEAP
jgi:uncharacterized protein